MKIAIIDYGAGNVQSVLNAFLAIDQNHEIFISNQISEIKSANYLVLPGVGAFGDCMEGLRSVEGLLPELHNQINKEGKPFLGICVGMQVLASIGKEDGEHKGLGFIDGKVEKIPQKDDLKVPHMGWNNLQIKNNKHPILKDVKEGEHFYFANSYHFSCQNENNVLAQVEYSTKINAIISKRNILGIQFHPEKSGKAGLQILQNFLNWRP